MSASEMGNKSFRFLISAFIWSLRAFDAPLVDRYIAFLVMGKLLLSRLKVLTALQEKSCQVSFKVVRYECVISTHVQSMTSLLLSPASPGFYHAVPPQLLAQVADRRLDRFFLRVGV